jgi:DnaJ-domain-containing protein 1
MLFSAMAEETTRMLVRQQMLVIESGKDNSDHRVLLVDLEESLENLERDLARLMKDNKRSE